MVLDVLLRLTDPLTAVLLVVGGYHLGHRLDRLDRRVTRLEQAVLAADGGSDAGGGGLLARLPIGTETETDRDGFLSSRREVHAAVIGLGVGAFGALASRPEPVLVFVLVAIGVRAVPRGRLADVRREPWYAIGAALAGWTTPDVATALLELADVGVSVVLSAAPI